MQLDDTGIIALYFQRDESAIAQTEEKYGPSCRRVVRRILWDLRDVDECVSDTWLRTWNAIPPKRPNPLEAFIGSHAIWLSTATTTLRRRSGTPP